MADSGRMAGDYRATVGGRRANSGRMAGKQRADGGRTAGGWWTDGGGTAGGRQADEVRMAGVYLI